MLEENILAGLLYCLSSSSPARVPNTEPQGMDNFAQPLLYRLGVRREGVEGLEVKIQSVFIILKYDVSAYKPEKFREEFLVPVCEDVLSHVSFLFQNQWPKM